MSKSMQTGSFQWMKSLNKSIILNIIRLHGPISRAEIAKLTELTPPTVTNIANELLEENWILESERGESSGGRKPILLRLNAEAFHVVGVYAGAKKIRAVAATVDGSIMAEQEVLVGKGPTEAEYLRMLKELIRQVMQDSKAEQSSFLGIGVGMHGLVDPIQGISIFAPNIPLRNVKIKEVLETKFSLPVEVDNDVRALALGESWFGQGQGLSHFVCVNVGTGIGAGIILDGRLYQGASFTAGEIGHTTIDLHGPQCSCGNTGCLEALASGPSMEARVERAIASGEQSILHKPGSGADPVKVTGEEIFRAAVAGDQLAIRVMEETGTYLGVGIANLINSFNPSCIILSGGVFRANDYVLDSLRRTVQERALQTPTNALQIVTSELGKNAMAIGAFTLLLAKIFTPEGVSK
ncbi:ROK family transcriptional regulator [Brevibacillus sp. SYSU BS000544]|uniref:ROK family transcriptional regulator n=1 Tax=Brevibacillus sp. SYSU BS000544 TaxID=3416443 RepID=UPI003CE594D9